MQRSQRNANIREFLLTIMVAFATGISAIQHEKPTTIEFIRWAKLKRRIDEATNLQNGMKSKYIVNYGPFRHEN